MSQPGSVRLELPSDDIIRDPTYTGFDSDVNASAQKRGLFSKKTQTGLEDEEGVLLQPDFEFDDLGNIVEFDASKLSPHKRRRTSVSPRRSESPSKDRTSEREVSDSDLGLAQRFISRADQHFLGCGPSWGDPCIRAGQ